MGGIIAPNAEPFHESRQDGSKVRRHTIEVIKYRRVTFYDECDSDRVADAVLEHLSENTEPLDSFPHTALVSSQALLPVPGLKRSGARLMNRVFRPIAALRNRSINK